MSVSCSRVNIKLIFDKQRHYRGKVSAEFSFCFQWMKKYSSMKYGLFLLNNLIFIVIISWVFFLSLMVWLNRSAFFQKTSRNTISITTVYFDLRFTCSQDLVIFRMHVKFQLEIMSTSWVMPLFDRYRTKWWLWIKN